MKDKFYMWLAHKLPRRLVYFCAVRVAAYATTRQYASTIVPDLKALDALKRWDTK